MSSTVPGGAEAEASGSSQPPEPPPGQKTDPQPSPAPQAAAPQPPEAAEEALPAPPATRKVRLRRTRRFFRRPTVRVASALIGVLVIWVAFSAGQAVFASNGQGAAANLAEWARNHRLGPIVTFGEWLSYNPPKVGGQPTMSLAVPKGEQVTPVTPVTGTKATHKRKEFVPDIPAVLTSLAGKPITGEGQWRVVEKVNGEPAILTTFLRDATYTSYVNGVASIDQRLVRFYLRPGYEDPGYGNWKAPFDVPAGRRAGLLATFNGGFKISDAGGGFYLNGVHYDPLVNGAASIVYYKDGTVKIGQWGRDFRMNPSIAGVRQNLKLLVDRGRISPDLNQDIETGWGATLGGGYFVWRSGLGITSDGRIVYVYGPALDVQDLAELLRRAGAVEGMQMDINPAWMKFDYYQADGHPSDPTPVPLLPSQEASPYSYYDPSTRDFTAVYAR
jgi:Phosphodiester glycosidase